MNRATLCHKFFNQRFSVFEFTIFSPLRRVTLFKLKIPVWTVFSSIAVWGGNKRVMSLPWAFAPRLKKQLRSVFELSSWSRFPTIIVVTKSFLLFPFVWPRKTQFRFSCFRFLLYSKLILLTIFTFFSFLLSQVLNTNGYDYYNIRKMCILNYGSLNAARINMYL